MKPKSTAALISALGFLRMMLGAPWSTSREPPTELQKSTQPTTLCSEQQTWMGRV